MASDTDSRIRAATAEDLPAIVALLADDEIGATREDPGEVAAVYGPAFAEIAADPNQLLVVLEHDGAVAGCLQISVIPGLSRGGMWRGQIESVRIARDLRGAGHGSAFMRWAIAECRRRGCGLVQLSTEKTRGRARAFYESLGFAASHEGMKLAL